LFTSNLIAALLIASSAAFLVKEKYPILLGCVFLFNFSSTNVNSLVVLPVPGGPNIIFLILF
tara:strand:- start:114 stop:299 length:186 start_codon:yes stop_codon:yes gene_type:complete